MRLPSWTGALLALLLVSPPAERKEPSDRAATPAPRASEVELAVEWVEWGSAPGPATDPGVWRGGFRVANRGGGASGPVQLRVRTPLGLIAQRQLTTNLASSETFTGSVEVEVVPGLSEVCIDVRALDGERARPEPDSADNLACRRLSRPDRARAGASATLPPEAAP